MMYLTLLAGLPTRDASRRRSNLHLRLMAEPWTLDRGAQLHPDGSVRFSVWAPRLTAPRVRICTGPARGEYEMTSVDGEPGVVGVTVPNVGEGAEYVFSDGERTLSDPVSRSQPRGVTGASGVVDAK